jgi:hypothetical protein
MSDYDQRQYRRMLYTLGCIESGDFAAELVADLTALLGALETPDPSWARDFQSGLAGLDEDISVAIFRQHDEGDSASSNEVSFDEETAGSLRATAVQLKLLVLAKIEGSVDDMPGID